ncbi:MAG: heavy metal translocating P-type ATPase [bacterium]
MSTSLTKTEELRLEGLHCVDCAATIEKTMAKVNGVQAVQANFTAGKMKVSYDPLSVGYQDLVRCVERIGYRVSRENHRDLERKSLWRDRQVQFTALAGLALAAGLLAHFLTGDVTLFRAGRPVNVSTLFFLATIFFGAYHFSRAGVAAATQFRFRMDSLMSLAIMGAIIIEEYVEAASLAFLFSLAEILESYAVERARNSLRELMNLTPENATINREGRELEVPVEQVQRGEILVVRPGEKIALDGQVVYGASSVDQAPITGESVPVHKGPGEKVFAGSINNEGYLEVQVTHNSKTTMLARIIHLVEDAEAQKAPSERFVEKFARIYTPTVVVLAVMVATVPPLVLGAAFHPWSIRALTLLVIACPCALVISTPVSVVSALTAASRNGVLIKGGIYLEEMAKIKVIAFDKTGTLTRGRLQVAQVLPCNGMTKEELLRKAASLERHSEHPIAKAIVEAANGLELEETRNFKAIPGKGITAEVNGTAFVIGSPVLFRASGLELPDEQLQTLQQQGQTTMLIGSQSEIMGVIALADQIRPEAIEIIAQLQRVGKEVVMITGDNQETAKAIAAKLGISHYHPGLLPEKKAEMIRQLRRQHGKVAMVGDGINDAPALAAASVGIAMGAAGTDTALEISDIALMADDLSKLPYLVELSKRANRVIKQNTLAAILIKLSLALGVFPGFVTLVMAVLIGDMGASLGVTSNALRLARFNSRQTNPNP